MRVMELYDYNPYHRYTTVKVAADWASDSASDSAADWASDSAHFNRSKVHFEKYYFKSFLTYFSLQISVDLSNTTYLFIAERKLRLENMLVCERNETSKTLHIMSQFHSTQ